MLSFYLHYAWRSLRREGQRTLLAVLCIAFGVASLAGLSLLATATRSSIITDPRNELGGDLMLRLGTASDADATATLDQLQREGVLEQWMPFGTRYNLLLSTSEHTYYLNRLLAVEPTQYPLVGDIALRGGATLADALREPNSAIITRDLVAKRGLAVGDEIMIVEQAGSVPVRLHISAIAEAMPDKRGDTILVSQSTAAQASLYSATIALVTLGPNGQTLQKQHCSESGTLDGNEATAYAQALCQTWVIDGTPERTPSGQAVADIFDLMLKGAGLLGLLVGGIGIANTLQVLLARRRQELAILATVGYPRRHLIALVAIETLLLGVLGSVLGALGAIALSIPLTTMLGASEGSIMIERTVTVGPLLSGMAAGIATALIFGLAASVRASAVRPAALLRDQPIELPRGSWLATVGLWLLLGLLFALLSSVVMRSALAGLAVVALAVGGLVLLGGLFALMLKLLVRLPLPGGRLLALAQHNLKRQGLRPLFALIALWAGIFSVGFAGNSILNAQRRIESQRPDLPGEIIIVAPRRDAETLREQLGAHSIEGQLRPRLTTNVTWADEVIPAFTLEGRNDADLATLLLDGEPWGGEGVYVDEARASWQDKQGHPMAVGDVLTLNLPDGGTQTVRIAGFFTLPPEARQSSLYAADLVAPQAMVEALMGNEGSVVVVAPLATAQLAPASRALSEALPDALIYTSEDLANALMGALRSLFGFVVMVAGLALVAGAVLIANVVGLALVERRREVGILKAMGYSSGHVLRLLVLENLFLGAMGGLAGLVSLYIATAFVNLAEPIARLTVSPVTALALIAAALLVAVLSTVAVAWQPTRLRPLAVLREG